MKGSNKKIYRVLSIDFDYFQKAKEHTLMNCYLEGIDLNTKVSEFVWSSLYAFHGEEIKKVTIHKKHLNEIKRIIRAQSPETTCIVAQSHEHIYDFLKEGYANSSYTSCHLYNVDMHHDLFNDNDEMDCGNWIGHLKEEISCDVTWIANPVSKKVYELQNFDIIQEDLSVLKDKQFDFVFLCRSDAWIPPHLDIYFDDLLELMCRTFNEVMGDPQIQDPRDIEDIYESARKQMEFINNMKNKTKKRK